MLILHKLLKKISPDAMKQLSTSQNGVLIVKPRWPYRYVHVSERAYERLIKAQDFLDKKDIRLIVTRGYENEGSLLRAGHYVARILGAVLFTLLLPERRNEVKEIFSPNGHTSGGDCVDVGIAYRGQVIDLLPRGVFTTTAKIASIYDEHREVIDAVWNALAASGFTLHPNKTEAMQIHCEFKGS